MVWFFPKAVFLPQVPENAVDLHSGPLDPLAEEFPSNSFHRPYGVGPYFNLLRTPCRDQLAPVYSFGQRRGIREYPQVAEDLGELVVGEGSEFVHVVKASPAAAGEGAVEIRSKDLGSFVKKYLLVTVETGVSKGEEFLGNQLCQFHDGAGRGRYQPVGLPAVPALKHISKLPQDLNPLIHELGFPLALENPLEIGTGHLRQVCSAEDGNTRLHSPGQCGCKSKVPGEVFVAVPNPPAGLARWGPKTKIETVQHQHVGNRFRAFVYKMVSGIPGGYPDFASGQTVGEPNQRLGIDAYPLGFPDHPSDAVQNLLHASVHPLQVIGSPEIGAIICREVERCLHGSPVILSGAKDLGSNINQ
jgi:hypothetical protein